MTFKNLDISKLRPDVIPNLGCFNGVIVHVTIVEESAKKLFK